MRCCSNCFADTSLQRIITSLSNDVGKCDFCGSDNSFVLNCEELSVYFDGIFELYTPSPNAIGSLKVNNPFLLHEHLNAFWPNLFNNALLNDRLIKLLVDNIGKAGEIYREELNQVPVEFSYIVNGLRNEFENLELTWDSFADDIKYHNRFFLNKKLDTELLQSIFERLEYTFPSETEFFRGRISDHILEVESMGKPPVSSTTAGRANPVGIPYLYLSNDLKTTLYETRVSLHETLTVGKFVSTEPISLVSLKKIDSLGPFEIQDKGFSIDEFIEYRPYLQRLESELSRPVRKQDVHLDYLPTQFLCEFFKSIGFDAVEYRSAMNADGSNIALFDDKKVKCLETKFVKINSLTYNWSEL